VAGRSDQGAGITRRSLLAGTAALATIGPGGRSVAQEAAPKVFLDYTQKELDDAYNQGVWAPNARELIAGYTSRSVATRQHLAHRSDVPYGPSADEMLDIFSATQAGAPIHVFIHGGAWNSGGKEDYSFPAETFVPSGATYIAVGFANIPKATLPEMADQARRAIVWICRNAASFGGDPDRIFISGHSSGGHLAGVLLTTDWAALGVPETVIKGGLCASGVYDLHPVMLSSRSSYVKLSEDEVASLSPIRHLDRLRCPVGIVHGDHESPEFKRQGKEFAAAFASARYPSTFGILNGLNHFEVADSLADPHAPLSQMALRQMGLAAL
jgi:arylformamidase